MRFLARNVCFSVLATKIGLLQQKFYWLPNLGSDNSDSVGKKFTVTHKKSSQLVQNFTLVCVLLLRLTTLQILLPSFKAFLSYSSFSPGGVKTLPVAGGPCNFIVAGGPLRGLRGIKGD